MVEYAAAFDMHLRAPLEKRLEYLCHIGNIYCKSYVHNVADESEDEFWQEYQISIRYPAKIDCEVDDSLKEFEHVRPICNKLWQPPYS